MYSKKLVIYQSGLSFKTVAHLSALFVHLEASFILTYDHVLFYAEKGVKVGIFRLYDRKKTYGYYKSKLKYY